MSTKRRYDQLFKAYEYQPRLLPDTSAPAVRLRDIAQVERFGRRHSQLGLTNNQPSVMLAIFRSLREHDRTVDRILALFLAWQASISPSLHLNVAIDRSHKNHQPTSARKLESLNSRRHPSTGWWCSAVNCHVQMQ